MDVFSTLKHETRDSHASSISKLLTSDDTALLNDVDVDVDVDVAVVCFVVKHNY